MVISFTLIIIGLIILVISINVLLKIKQIKQKGIQTEGIIFDLEMSEGSNITTSSPIVRFKTVEGEWITAASQVNILSNFYKKGKQVSIIYDSSNPQNFWIESNVSIYCFQLAGIISVALIIIGVIKLFQLET